MATQTCKDCNEPVSSEIYRCPHCRRATFGGIVNDLIRSEFVLVVLLVICFKFLTV